MIHFIKNNKVFTFFVLIPFLFVIGATLFAFLYYTENLSLLGLYGVDENFLLNLLIFSSLFLTIFSVPSLIYDILKNYYANNQSWKWKLIFLFIVEFIGISVPTFVFIYSIIFVLPLSLIIFFISLIILVIRLKLLKNLYARRTIIIGVLISSALFYYFIFHIASHLL